MQYQPVIPSLGRGLIGETEMEKRLVKPVSAPVSGKYPARPVSSMSCRCQPDDHQPGVRVSQCGYWPSPIRLALKSPDLFTGNALAPLHQARALPAPCDFLPRVLRISSGRMTFPYSRSPRSKLQRSKGTSRISSPFDHSRENTCRKFGMSPSIEQIGLAQLRSAVFLSCSRNGAFGHEEIL